ncbi:Transposase DDE domain-containing protein [Butyrivibrio fibrisolvens DSM 3071]|uniref:Transposase DDE domain-containing protein n=4 Tax=Butyrivibrio fibrisolvens TaxID=831 RepID=A0A1M6GT88_BUTFI|nr:transposase [Butyrivibrio fibrisolvens]SHJ13168.1 Transposase DDE domain-containing protein [Butyrivibrio fibrisolvens DSM 3071]
MYLDAYVKVPEVKGKITFRTKGNTTYVEFEYDRVYSTEKQYTDVKRKTIGKLADEDKRIMQPNENFIKFFPDIELPEERDRSSRSCGLRIGTWVVIRKIVNEYKLAEILGRYLPWKDVGLFLDLVAYSIIEEDNRAQHYPAYAYSHPLFSEGMRIYSDSKVSEFLNTMDADTSVMFQNDWNAERNHRERIYFSYDSTSKICEAGDLRIVEVGHSKENVETDIFNYAIAYDTKNREPLFYEIYPGSINDMSQFQCTVEKAKGYGYKKIGFVLDRGYFSKDNIYQLEDSGYSFVMMLKGKADLVQKWVLENKGSFETSRSCNIPAYQVYGKTIEKKLFGTDKKPRYIHLYHSSSLEADERTGVEKKINQLTAFLNSHINQFRDFGPGMETYFELHYDENAKKTGKKDKDTADSSARKFVFFEEKMPVIELELKLCGYFVIVTSEKMTAKEALEIYKGRDASEKLFLSDKTFLGNHCLRIGSDESATSKIFIEFVALIIRNRMYNYLKDEMKEMATKPNYMTVPAAIRELDKIEMSRQLDGVYRFDHAITAKQKTILKAFGLTDANVKYRAQEISKMLEMAD